MLDVLILAAAAAGTTANATVPMAPFTLVCDESIKGQTLTNIRAGQSLPKAEVKVKSERRTQHYEINPVLKTVRTKFGYESEANPWVEKINDFKNVTISPGGRIVYCVRTDEKPCTVKHGKSEQLPSGATRTVSFTTGQTILHLGRNTSTYWSVFDVQASDNSFYTNYQSVEGTCQRA